MTFNSQSKSSEPASLLARPGVVVTLVAVCSLTFAASVVLAVVAPALMPLQLAQITLSGAAALLASVAARSVFRRRRRDSDRLITVCAWTRRVHWQGRWVSFEEYLAGRFNLRCTHGICEEAVQKIRNESSQRGDTPTRTPADAAR